MPPKRTAKPPAPKKRRARGTGSGPVPKKGGGYRAKVPVGKYPNGLTKYVQVSGPTQAAVVELTKAVRPPGPTTTVGQWAELWLKGLTNRPSTRAVYAHSVNRHVLPEVGHVRLADLTVSQVKAAAAKWTGLRASTVNVTLDRATTMFAAAVADGLAAKNPFALCPRREHQPKPIDPFAPEELRAVVAAWRTVKTCGPLYAFLATTGCREGEATALDVTDYDPGTGAVVIAKTYSPRWGVGPPKSKHSFRTLDLPPGEVRAALAHAIRGRAAGPLFATATGKRIDHSQIYGGFKALLNRLGLRRRSPHKLRHGIATALISDGMPIGDVAKWLGDTEETIVRTYLHPTGADVGAAIGRILGG